MEGHHSASSFRRSSRCQADNSTSREGRCASTASPLKHLDHLCVDSGRCVEIGYTNTTVHGNGDLGLNSVTRATYNEGVFFGYHSNEKNLTIGTSLVLSSVSKGVHVQSFKTDQQQ